MSLQSWHLCSLVAHVLFWLLGTAAPARPVSPLPTHCVKCCCIMESNEEGEQGPRGQRVQGRHEFRGRGQTAMLQAAMPPHCHAATLS